MDFQISARFICFLYLAMVLSETCRASTQNNGQISPHFEGTQMNWIDKNGLFLLSNNKNFAFGFSKTNDVTLFLLGVVHIGSLKVVWTANRGAPVGNADKFVFDTDGNVYLRSGANVVWSSNTTGKGVTVMELQDSGNLVLLNNQSILIWQSFNSPTDTLLPGQNFTSGMRLVSSPNKNHLSYHLEISSGDLMLYVDFKPPQPYWSMQKDSRKVINMVDGDIHTAALDSNSLRTYDKNRSLLSQLILADKSNPNITWAAVLDNDGFFSFFALQSEGANSAQPVRIPQDPCDTPEACDPYYICHSKNRCQCPAPLSSDSNCKPNIGSPCSAEDDVELINVGDRLKYFATGFVPPASNSTVTSCKKMCTDNCSCLAMFFEEKSGNCFLFGEIGSLQQDESTGFVSYLKVSTQENGSNPGEKGGNGKKQFPIVVVIVLGTLLVIAGIIYIGVVYYRKMYHKPSHSSSEDDNFLEELAGMPVRFSYRDLQNATSNFSVKLGQGGFGSVYHGVLPDGTHIAVKQLESIGQGKKEFRSEVSTIGSIHHVHLVKLRGFCAEGAHRLLVYEYMAKGSLDRWIFWSDNEEGLFLDWDTRLNIALATAKGLAYLHEDCSVKIVHCDIKPENVLLDDNYVAKVSDFGLAKMMTREQSHVFTTMRGTRGYLAPEWITNYAISEKSDVYSFGMVMLEIIGGRKNYDPSQISEKSYFPSYAFKKMEEGKLKEVLDSKLRFDEHDERISSAIKVALWCIQEDMHLRPSMTKVVQMLEGICEVPQPPTSSQIGFRSYSSISKLVSEEGTSSAPSDCNSEALLSAVRLSGPRDAKYYWNTFSIV